MCACKDKKQKLGKLPPLTKCDCIQAPCNCQPDIKPIGGGFYDINNTNDPTQLTANATDTFKTFYNQNPGVVLIGGLVLAYLLFKN